MLGLLYTSPQSSCEKNQRSNQVNDPWYILAVLTGKPEFGAPNCPVRALKQCHRYIKEGQAPPIYPFKDNNAGKELSATSISRWTCTTIVYSHASIQSSKNIPGKVKAHEVCAVAALQLFNKEDLQAVMKARRWARRGTYTSFYLQDLCPQADGIQKTGPVVAAGEIVEIS